MQTRAWSESRGTFNETRIRQEMVRMNLFCLILECAVASASEDRITLNRGDSISFVLQFCQVNPEGRTFNKMLAMIS